MNKESKICQECPFNDPCRIQTRANRILEFIAETDLPKKDAKRKATERVSAMTLEGKQLECPPDEVREIRMQTLGKIDPQLEERDKNFYRPVTGHEEINEADLYLRDRRMDWNQSESYEQYRHRSRRETRR